jgi:DNA primase small subunit
MLAEQDFTHRMFSEYYRNHYKEIKPPSSVSQREFGFLLSREKMMVRHRSFGTPEELQEFILSSVPADVYYSSAYYEHPTETMEKKGWLGADLIFDIDSDHLDTPCKRGHDFWICEACNNSGRGDKPNTCPNCGGTKFKMEAWLCEKCLDAVKVETQKLLDFLISDFGFPPEKTMTCFSGQRGYHVHIEGVEVRELDQEARKEIADYITATGLRLESHGFEVSKGVKIGPDLDDYGWDGRIARGVYDIVSSSSSDDLQKYGISRGNAKTLSNNKNRILEMWGKNSPWRTSNISLEAWKTLASKGTVRHASQIDTVVTTDIHRLIRLPLTLHGKTGMKSMEVQAQRLEAFDPLKEAIAFTEGTICLFVNDAPPFRIGDRVYGPYHQKKIDIPTAAAIYLLSKRAAKLIQD